MRSRYVAVVPTSLLILVGYFPTIPYLFLNSLVHNPGGYKLNFSSFDFVLSVEANILAKIPVQMSVTTYLKWVHIIPLNVSDFFFGLQFTVACQERSLIR